MPNNSDEKSCGVLTSGMLEVGLGFMNVLASTVWTPLPPAHVASPLLSGSLLYSHLLEQFNCSCICHDSMSSKKQSFPFGFCSTAWPDKLQWPFSMLVDRGSSTGCWWQKVTKKTNIMQPFAAVEGSGLVLSSEKVEH